jgi:hypothetical protein
MDCGTVGKQDRIKKFEKGREKEGEMIIRNELQTREKTKDVIKLRG